MRALPDGLPPWNAFGGRLVRAANYTSESMAGANGSHHMNADHKEAVPGASRQQQAMDRQSLLAN